MPALRPSLNSFMPLEEASDLLCGVRWPGEVWSAMKKRSPRGSPTNEIERAFYQVAYEIWQAVRHEKLQLYLLHPNTQEYIPAEHDRLRRSAALYADVARRLDASAIVDWLEGRRRFDAAFYEEVRRDENATGQDLEGPLRYNAEFYVRTKELYWWMSPLILRLAPSSTHHVDTDRSDDGKKRPQARKYIYERTWMLLGETPGLSNDEVISRLRQFGIKERGNKVVWDSGGESVKLTAFRRHLRGIRRKILQERK